MPGGGCRAYAGLGANLGRPREAIAAALCAIARLPGTALECVSSLYLSAPVQAQGPDFLNAVARLHTTLGARELLEALHAIERSHGRERPYRNAPRTLDLDLLLYGDLLCDTPELRLPHPRMHLRAFVLAPLVEIAPDLVIPGRGAAAELLGACADQRIERVASPADLLGQARCSPAAARPPAPAVER
jgi:2-amino-4-hydroxy-6-hydroxymethyldihydropteridine diphosphokinase